MGIPQMNEKGQERATAKFFGTATIEQMAAELAAVTEPGRGLALQLARLFFYQKLAEQNGMPTGGCSLGDCILREMLERRARFSEQAYPMTEKQILVVLREMAPYRTRE